VALLRERFPADSAAQTTRRLLSAADPSPAGAVSPDYGHGLVNPLRALTEAGSARDPGSARVSLPEEPAAGSRALWFSAVALAGSVVAGALLAVMVRGCRRGRAGGWHRRRWRDGCPETNHTTGSPHRATWWDRHPPEDQQRA
jgi:membrane-anchored mycosin MYCP